MSDFYLYFQIGIKHVLDWNGYDHVLFLAVLAAPYLFKDWKRILLLVSFFTVGHTVSLLLSVFGLLTAKGNFIELLIPITIAITAIYNIFTAGKTQKNNSINLVSIITLGFGIVHGLGFSNYFKNLLSGSATSKLLPTLEFALGIEAAQIIVVLSVLLLAYIVQNFFKFSKRDFVLVVSSIVLGVVMPMIIERW
jgi:hypothetical protein